MNQQLFSRPFCDAPSYRTRYKLWMHMRECMKKNLENKSTSGISTEESAVVKIAYI